MEKSGLFSSLEAPIASGGLVRGILKRIEREELFRLRRNAAVVSTCTVACFGALIESVRITAIQLSLSGFTQFASSLFFDTDAIFAGGSSYFFALLESFPFFYASITLGVVLVLGIVIPIFWHSIRILKDFSFTRSIHTL